MRLDHRLVIALLICTATSSAQQAGELKPTNTPEKATPAGVVTGHVFLDDTKSPARKATVYLQPVAPLQTDAPPDRGNKGNPSVAMETLIDGSFTFTHVTPGSYYLLATSPGYVSPFVTLSLAEDRSAWGARTPLGPQQKEARDKVLQSLPRVEAQSSQPASADLILERGAAVSGTITYDDGVPASGLRVQLLVRMLQDGKETWTPLNLVYGEFWDQHMTDDRGNFRISGLPPGKYALEVDLQFMQSRTYFDSSSTLSAGGAHAARLAIYSGNTTREKDIAAFTLETREERTGEDIVIPISRLHTIRGSIVSADDGHLVNSGQVSLLNAGDGSYAGSDSLSEDQTSFVLTFIFEGDYILSSPGSADVDYLPVPRPEGSMGSPQFNTRVLHLYGATCTPLHVDRDMDGVIIAVPQPTAKELQMYKNAMQQDNQTPPAQ